METYTLLNGRLTLLKQNRNSSEDAIWLACSTTPKPNDSIFDAGCGNGVVGLALAKRFSHPINLTGMDICPDAMQHAMANAKLNEQPFTPLNGCILNKAPNHIFSHTLANPPFHFLEEGYDCSNDKKKNAHGIQREKIMEWRNRLIECTKPEGTITLIVHSKCVDLLTSDQRARVLYLNTRPDTASKRAIIQFGSTQGVSELNTWDQKARQHCLKEGNCIWEIAQAV